MLILLMGYYVCLINIITINMDYNIIIKAQLHFVIVVAVSG